MKWTLWITLAVLITASPLAAAELKVPALPKSTSLAGSMLYEGHWYAMGSKEIACVNKLLAGKPYRKPDNIDTESYPPMNNRIILWGTDGGRLVPTDVIEFDFRASWLSSQKNSDTYNTKGAKEYQPLRKLVERISEGKEHPVAMEPEKSHRK